MEIYNRSQVTGNNVSLKTTMKKHISDKVSTPANDDPVRPFADVLLSAVNDVNNLQQNAAGLEQKLVIDPDSVNIHEVMIASEKARLSLSLMKTLTDKALKAYTDILMIR